LIARLLLALAVVLFQHGAVAHALVHVGEEVGHEQHDGDLHAPHGCDACHAYAAADGGGAPAQGLPPHAAAPAASVSPVGAALPDTAPVRLFDSRAPPAHP
jgi:hypothetical protein